MIMKVSFMDILPVQKTLDKLYIKVFLEQCIVISFFVDQNIC